MEVVVALLNSCVETVAPNMIAFEDESFGK